MGKATQRVSRHTATAHSAKNAAPFSFSLLRTPIFPKLVCPKQLEGPKKWHKGSERGGLLFAFETNTKPRQIKQTNPSGGYKYNLRAAPEALCYINYQIFSSEFMLKQLVHLVLQLLNDLPSPHLNLPVKAQHSSHPAKRIDNKATRWSRERFVRSDRKQGGRLPKKKTPMKRRQQPRRRLGGKASVH